MEESTNRPGDPGDPGAPGDPGTPSAGQRGDADAGQRGDADAGQRGDGDGPVGPFGAGIGPECMFCPICTFLATLRQSRPEAAEHLFKAGHELFLAMKAAVEGADANWERTRTLQRIRVR